MKLGIVISSADAETVWNAFRLGVFSLNNGDAVKVFLLAKGVECESPPCPKSIPQGSFSGPGLRGPKVAQSL